MPRMPQNISKQTTMLHGKQECHVDKYIWTWSAQYGLKLVRKSVTYFKTRILLVLKAHFPPTLWSMTMAKTNQESLPNTR
jgi:hypothetical protein